MASLSRIKISKDVLIIAFLIILSVPLRFIDLGYSDYIPDERKALITVSENSNLWQFLMSQRKGPVQFLVSYIPYLFTHNFRNELAERIPFALISVAVVVLFYLLVKKITKNTVAAFSAACLLAVNGFIVGFGRIVQYQNLNLLFNFLALIFYSDLLFKDKGLFKSSLLGTAFFALSILSHWDAIFIIPMIVYFFGVFLINKKFTGEYKIRLVIYNLILGCVLLLPFLVPYTLNVFTNSENQDYFAKRISSGYSNNSIYLLWIRLYNPFVFFELVATAAAIGAFFFKKSLPFLAWGGISYLLFDLFVRKPGTHIYNFIVPAIILAGLGVALLTRYLPKFLKWLPTTALLLAVSFLYYQTYLLFVDHTKEYPVEQKTYFREAIFTKSPNYIAKYLPALKTSKYTIDQKIPMFGFPHYRYWNQINNFVNTKNKENGEKYTYITNEDKDFTDWYMDVRYNNANGFYIIGIKRPLSFVGDSSYPQYPNKEIVKTFYKDSEKVVTIYRVPAQLDIDNKVKPN